MQTFLPYPDFEGSGVKMTEEEINQISGILCKARARVRQRMYACDEENDAAGYIREKKLDRHISDLILLLISARTI